MAKKRKKRVKRGHPIAILIGLHDNDAIFWRIFSETIRLHLKVNRGRKRRNQDKKQLFHSSVHRSLPGLQRYRFLQHTAQEV